MIIAVDFDGTIVEHKYPKIGKELPFAIETLLDLKADGHQLILWTARDGELLDEAIKFCKDRGLEFYAVNSNYPEEMALTDVLKPRKLTADLFIDDRNLGGIPDWGVIYQMIHSGRPYQPMQASTSYDAQPKRKSLLERLMERRR